MKKIKIISLSVFLLVLVSILMSTGAVYAFDKYEIKQWYLDKIKAKDAWEITKGDSAVVVAVIDTGVDLDHPDLKENIWVNTSEIPGDNLDNDLNGYIDDINGWNFFDNNNLVEPDVSGEYSTGAVKHGTFLAGIISAVHDNNQGIKGVTSNVKIMPIVVLNPDGQGTSVDVAKAINYAVANGAVVINLSFGGDERSPELRSAILNAYNAGVVIVAAGGNNSPGGYDLAKTKIYPVCYDAEWSWNTIIGVGAVSKQSKLSSFSNYGGGCIDIVAPGEEILSLSFQTDTNSDLRNYISDNFYGTSFSTAMVTGTAALIKSINRNIPIEDVYDIIINNSVDLTKYNPLLKSNALGAGLLDVQAALSEATDKFGPENQLTFYVSADSGLPGRVLQYDGSFTHRADVDILGDKFEGLNISTKDLDFDDKNDIVAGARDGYIPFVRGVSPGGVLMSSFLAFEKDFRGGVRATAGELTGDDVIEYVVVPQGNRDPVVRIFTNQGKLVKEFLAFDKKYKDGLTVAVGNVVGDDKDEILVGSPYGAVAEVKVFDFEGKLLKSYRPFGESFTGGVNIDVKNLDNVGYDEILFGAGKGGGPHVQVINYDGSEVTSFFAYNMNFRGGVRVTAGDYDNDGILEIITTPGPGGGPHVRIYDLNASMKGEFFALWATFYNGIQVTVR